MNNRIGKWEAMLIPVTWLGGTVCKQNTREMKVKLEVVGLGSAWEGDSLISLWLGFIMHAVSLQVGVAKQVLPTVHRSILLQHDCIQYCLLTSIIPTTTSRLPYSL